MLELVAAAAVCIFVGRTQVAPADTSAVVAAEVVDLPLDPAGHSSMRSLDGFSIPGCKCSNRGC